MRIYSVRSVVGTGIHTAWFSLVAAKIAGRRLFLGRGLVVRRFSWDFFARGEFVKIDVAVGAILRTQSATNAPVLDDDLERIATADRAHRTTNHA